KGPGPVLMRWKGWLDSQPPHDALQAIYDDGDVLARFVAAAPAIQRQTVLANLRALLAVALDRDGGRYATPYGLVRALKAGGTLAPAAVNSEAVRLLTIHGAKGLEAEAVLLLDTDTVERTADSMGVLIDWPGEASEPRKFVFLVSESRPPACAQEALATEQAARKREELNAFYVALTRARNTLVISSIEPHRETTDSWCKRLHGLAGGLMSEIAAPDSALALTADTAGDADIFNLPELPPLPDAMRLPPGAESPVDEDSARARIGKAMHRLLEWGGHSSAGHVSAVASEFRLSPAQATQACALALRILRGAGAWAWNEDAVAWQGNEVDLVYQGQPLRLDRLVRRRDAGHEGHWWVLDYKSAAAPEQQAALLAQMRAYRSAVQLIYPEATVKAAFLTGLGTMVELTSDVRLAGER
ncbi:MAG: 3'-5' exonuclease, partial [Polaromonas sp.]